VRRELETWIQNAHSERELETPVCAPDWGSKRRS